MFVSLSAALVQACGFGKEKERRTALWWRGGMEMEMEERWDKGKEERMMYFSVTSINGAEVKSSGRGRKSI